MATVLALRACAIQKAARLLPVPHGMIIRPRAALLRKKCFLASAIARRWCGFGLLAFGSAAAFLSIARWRISDQSAARKRSTPIRIVRDKVPIC